MMRNDWNLFDVLVAGFGEGDGDGENGAGRVELDPVTLVSGVQRQSPDLLAQGRNEATFA